jgi:hypothetical protein
MNRIITKREAMDNHHAQLIAQGMENAGADVFSVTGDSRGCISVYCRHNAMLPAEAIDEAIETVLGTKGAIYMAG